MKSLLHFSNFNSETTSTHVIVTVVSVGSVGIATSYRLDICTHWS